MCDVLTGGIPCLVATGVVNVGAPVSQAISFGTDPAGYVAQKMQAGANGLATEVLPALRTATEPDLSADWFLSTYKVSFALAILMWVVLMIWNLVQYSRKHIGGDELVESITVYSPVFIIGAVFGPLLGQLLVRLSGSLTDGLIKWGVAKSSASTTKGLTTLIGTGDPNLMTGGSLVAIAIYLVMIVALLMALVILVVMLVTLLFSGAVFSMGWVWITNAKDRVKGLKIAQVWGGVLFAQPLLFLMLGAALSLATGSTFGALAGENGSTGLKTLVGLVVAAIALLVAATSPALLLKFAPVGPTAAAPGGPGLGGLQSAKKGRGASGGGGEYSASNGQLAQIAQGNSDRGGGADSSGINAPSTGGAGSASGGGLSEIGASSGGGAAGAGAGAGASAGAKAGAAGGPAGMAAGTAAAAAAAVAAKAKEGAESAAGAAGGATEAAGSSAESRTGGAGAEAGEGSGLSAQAAGPGSDSIGAEAPSGDPAIPEPDRGSLSEMTGSSDGGNGGLGMGGSLDPGSDSTGAAASSGDAVGTGDSGPATQWPAPTGDPVAPVVLDEQEPSGGFRQSLGQVASVAGSVVGFAAKATNTMAGVAQGAAGHAEEHMDHHKAAPRAHR